MPRLLTYKRRMWLDRAADQVALAACLALPVALLHARAVAEILIAAIDVVFLVHVWAMRDVAFLDRRFTWAASAWWLWLVLCSALGSGGLLLGILAIRLPLLACALGDWLLPRRVGTGRRRWLWIALAAAAAWIAVESWQQYLLGTNLFGQARWGDGALTGPFNKPRAGPAMILLFFPVVVPAVAALLAGKAWHRLAALMLAGFAVITMVLIGQRMPFILMGLGLVVSALLLPRLRLALAVAAGVGAAMLAALPVLSPATQGKLVLQFSDQLRHFAASDYGLIFVRALTIAQLHPWIGLGFDGFRRGCSDFWAMHGIDWLGIPTVQFNGGLHACNLHPHNYYLEALDDAGLPGLALFALLVMTALLRLGRGLRGPVRGLSAGLFVGALVALWPIASTSAFTSMPNGGWVFLLLGLGFAVAGNDGRGSPFEDAGRRREWP